MNPARHLSQSLFIRLALVALAALFLFAYALRMIYERDYSEFTLNQAGSTLVRNARDLCNLTTRRSGENLNEDADAKYGEKSMAKRLALADIAAYLSDRGRGGLVYNGVTQEILLSRDLPPGLKNQALISHAWDKDRVTPFDSGGKRYLAVHAEFAPWSWHIVVVASPAASEGPGASIILVLTVVAALGMAAVIAHIVDQPLQEIAGCVRRGETPPNVGFGTTMALAGSIGQVMAAARETSERTQSLFDTIGALILVLDKDLRVTSANAAVERVLGMGASELLGKHIWDGVTPAESFSMIRGVFYKMLKERTPVTFESPIQSAELGLIDIIWTCAAGFGERDEVKWIIVTGLDIHELRRALAEIRGLNETLEERVASRTAQLSAANQELVDTLETLRKTQFRLVQAESLASLGGLVAGMTHEINTPVGVGVTAASHLEEKTRLFTRLFSEGGAKRCDLDDYLKLCTEATQIMLVNMRRASELIATFKKVAVDQCSADRRVVKPLEYINEVLLSLRPRLKKTRHEIEVDVDPELLLDTYPGAFCQIVTNLVCNSLQHAFGEGESGRISFSLARVGAGYRFDYRDNGRGIDRSNLSRIFEPFFTTAKDRGGTGLGMHIVHHLAIETLGGSIRCESAPGEGAHFIIDLPEHPPEQML